MSVARTLLAALTPALLFAQYPLKVIHPLYPGGSAVFAAGSRVDLQAAFCAGSRETVVTVSSAGQTFPVRVLPSFPRGGCSYTIHAVLPDDLPTGEAVVSAKLDGLPYEDATILIVPTRFGFFPGARHPDGARANLTHPVVAGNRFTLRGTGLGRTTADDLAATLGTQAIVVESVGKVEGEPGLDEVRMRLPANLSFTGCYVPIETSLRGVALNPLTLSVAQSTGPCRHPLSLSASELATLDAGRAIPIGVADFEAGLFSRVTPNYAAPRFYPAAAAEVERVSGPQYPQPRNSCQILTGGPFIATLGGVAPILYLDAGAARLQMPSGKQIPLLATADPDPPSPEAGTTQLRFDGGEDIQPVSATFAVSRFPQLRAVPPEFTYGAAQEIRIQWDATSLGPDDEITLIVTAARTAGLALQCQAPARDGARVLPIGSLLARAQAASAGAWPAFLRMTVAPRPGSSPSFRFRLTNEVQSSGIIRLPVGMVYAVTLREVLP